jgi:hypothetical protein
MTRRSSSLFDRFAPDKHNGMHWVGGWVSLRPDLVEVAKKNIAASPGNWTPVVHLSEYTEKILFMSINMMQGNILKADNYLNLIYIKDSCNIN